MAMECRGLYSWWNCFCKQPQGHHLRICDCWVWGKEIENYVVWVELQVVGERLPPTVMINIIIGVPLSILAT